MKYEVVIVERDHRQGSSVIVEAIIREIEKLNQSGTKLHSLLPVLNGGDTMHICMITEKE